MAEDNRDTSNTTFFTLDFGQLQEKAKRKRQGGPRSKTGCITCRLRRVKCDEVRPECIRCINAKRKCEGYPSIFAMKKPWELIMVPSLGSMIKPSSNPRVASNDHASQSYIFFEKMTIGKLAEVFGKELWTESLPRAARYCPAISQATIALGSAHEAHLMKNIGNDLHASKTNWTFEQYNRAIRKLTHPTSGERPPLDVMIATSIMFMAFEMLRREHGRAVGYAKSGINMFREYRRKLAEDDRAASNKPLIPLSHLERSLRQVEIQLCEVTLDHYPSYPLPTVSLFDRESMPHGYIPQPSASGTFNDLNEARIELGWLWHSLMDKLHFAPTPELYGPMTLQDGFEGQRALYYQSLHVWSERFSELTDYLTSRPMPLTSLERGSIARLQMHELLLLQLLQTYKCQDETIWDQYTDRFEHILDLCRITASNDQFGDPACDMAKVDTYCGFQLGNGIIAACFHVIWKCRDARVRHKGLELLRNYPRRECLWDAQIVVRVGEQLDELERGPDQILNAALRGAGPEEIPGWARVRSVGVKFGATDHVVDLTFVKPRCPTEDDLVEIKRAIAW